MATKKILGLDLGTNSIGWAWVEESNCEEQSKLIDCGVRIASLSSDEKANFEKGKSFSLAQERTQKRGARRNLDRYQQRRKELHKYLKESDIIDKHFVLAENGKGTKHEICKLRAKSAIEKIDLKDFARVLFAINKKRGYKSNRKVQQDEKEGEAIDGMNIAKKLSRENITVGEYVLEQLEKIKKENFLRDKKNQKKYKVPTFYRSDLQDEFDTIWAEQSKYHTELTEELKKELNGKNKGGTESIFKRILSDNFKKEWQRLWEENKENHTEKFTNQKFETFNEDKQESSDIVKFFDEINVCLEPIYIAEPKNEQGKKANTEEKKYGFYKWRAEALFQKLALNEVFAILVEINNQIKQSSGYLGAISDRSKELHFNKQTIGQYLYEQIQQNPHTRLKKQIFYRKDYEDEFETVWNKQKGFYPEILTNALKKDIKDITIFYQRPLKSCKHLVGTCEFERWTYVDKKTGKPKETGMKVCPKSSPLFQEFRIWQNINNLIFKRGKEKIELNQEAKQALFKAANIKKQLSKNDVFKILGYSEEYYKLNFKHIEGNRTNEKIYNAFQVILEEEGYDLNFSKMNADDILDAVSSIFKVLKIDTKILDFDSSLTGDDFDKQPAYKFWHILYSVESPEAVVKKLKEFGFRDKHAKILSNVVFEQDYGNLSSKALKKILPFMKQGFMYDEACKKAGYNHSHSLTKEENENRRLEDKMELLSKNSLRNPVVEKILNQMINTVNAIIEKYGKPDEVRLEMARELKKSAKEREEATKGINNATKKHKEIEEKLKKDLTRVTRNDIIKYKLWEESNKISIYTGKPIKGSDVFNGSYDIEHIIPKALLFDDSFSNKTLCESNLNTDKSNKTAYDFLKEKYNEEQFNNYKTRVEDLYKDKKIGKAKRDKLLMSQNEIPENFIERDLRNTQYIAKKAKSLLEKVFRNVHTTTGSITDRMRNDWQLTEVMKEINLEKYKALGMVYYEESKQDKNGKTQTLTKIKDWTKRDDHRHHAVDAIITAFTKHEHVQYLNSLNELNSNKEKLENLYANTSDAKWQKLAMLKTFEKNYLHIKTDKNGNKKGSLKFNMPYTNFKNDVKQALNGILISQKANNKVVTKNKNKIKGKDKYQETLTPRGSLHKETVYGSSQYYQTQEEKIGTKFDEAKIKQVAKKSYREALLKRLEEFENNPKKAFGGKNRPAKNPVLGENGKPLPKKVKIQWLEKRYTIRKPIDKDLKVEKIIDKGIKKILQERLDEFEGDKKKAFANLDENPIWFNEEKGIAIKRVTIEGMKNVESLGVKKDHLGNKITDENGKEISSGFVQTGNNHHVAIYQDENKNWQEEVVTFWEAVERARQNMPVIKTKHEKGWRFLFSMAINDYFILGDETFNKPVKVDLSDPKNKALISKHLFRVQKISTREYVFRHHLETTINRSIRGISYEKYQSLPTVIREDKETGGREYKKLHTFRQVAKVRLDHLGNIVDVIFSNNA